MKKILWNQKARELVRSLDDETKREIGTLLMILQNGAMLKEPQSKPMRSIHPHAYELRIKDKKGNYRVIYAIGIADAILIPHAFVKKTQKTLFREISIARQRLKELIDEIK